MAQIRRIHLPSLVRWTLVLVVSGTIHFEIGKPRNLSNARLFLSMQEPHVDLNLDRFLVS